MGILWLNLPAKYKITPPKYYDIKKEDVPVSDEDGSKVHIMAGEYNGKNGAFNELDNDIFIK